MIRPFNGSLRYRLSQREIYLEQAIDRPISLHADTVLVRGSKATFGARIMAQKMIAKEAVKPR